MSVARGVSVLKPELNRARAQAHRFTIYFGCLHLLLGT